MAKKVNKKAKLNEKYDLRKKDKYVNDDAQEIKRFIFILITIIVFILIVYGITKIFVKEEVIPDDVNAGAIDYDVVSVGTMLNRADKEYYVMVYDSKDTNAVYYASLINIYQSKKDALPVYFCDLSNTLNKDYYVGKDGKSNPKAKDVTELAFSDLTLLKVKSGKITKYIEDLDTIKTELKK